jgi:O-methyltransferase
MNNTDIDTLLNGNLQLCKRICMNDPLEVNGVLRKLIHVLNTNIPGDIVELGCNNGGTSYWIQTILNKYNSNRAFHVYDSWEGVPEKHYNDTTEYFYDDIGEQIGGNRMVRDPFTTVQMNRNWQKGTTATQKENFIQTFRENGDVKLPIIHSGWFKDIPDSEYPEMIAFAYFDGDFYTSIIDSFNKVYHKMAPGGIIVIDDCGDNTLIGVKKACLVFLKDKPETLNLNAYPSIDGVWDRTNFDTCFWGGWIQKV